MENFNIDEVKKLNEILLNIHNNRLEILFTNLCAELSELISFKYSMTSLSNNFNKRFESFHYQSIDLDEKALKDYVEYYEKLDFSTWYAAQPIPNVYRNSDLITQKTLHDSVLFKEWMQPLGIYYSLFGSAAINGINYCVVSLMRGNEDGDFSDKDVTILQIINKHISLRLSHLYPTGINKSTFDKSASSLSAAYHLTNREYEIIRNLSTGITRDELAEKLVISPNTLKKHMANIYKKFNINTEAQLYAIISSKEQ